MNGEETSTRLLNWATKKLEAISNMKSPKKNLFAFLTWLLLIAAVVAIVALGVMVVMAYARGFGALLTAFHDAFYGSSPNVRVVVFGTLVIYFAHMMFFRRKPATVKSNPVLMGNVTVAINSDILREPRPRVTINMKDVAAQITEASGVEYLTFNVPRASLAKDNAILVRLGP
jgi:hypothetical protein